MPARCDIAVVGGGGPAGSTVAALLAGAGLAVFCFEGKRFPRLHVGELASRTSLPLFEGPGVVGVVLHQRALRELWLRARLECRRRAVRQPRWLGRRRGRPAESQLS